ncbi:hypothetical protein [Streptomyces umbrinus]|uniref:hypothetical protein n=1 Tax=Streptomyces umbrinus TaxID=67370 RepID=UPI00340F6595
MPEPAAAAALAGGGSPVSLAPSATLAGCRSPVTASFTDCTRLSWVSSMGADIPTTRAAYSPLICPVVPKSTAAPAPIAVCTTAAMMSVEGSKYSWSSGA